MSRVLAHILGATEPAFRQQINRLEQAAGLPGADIRLMMHIVSETRSKIRDLGLDPHDTTGSELYATLQARLADDEVRIRERLGLSQNAEPQATLEAVTRYLTNQKLPTSTFVIKQTVMRAMLKKLQPKNTMKKLGYRSMDSMLKHEPLAQLLVATSLVESSEWQEKRLEAYKKLLAHDFESKKVSFLAPAGKHWPELARNHVSNYRHNIITVPELGANIVLPLPHDLPALAITTILVMMDNLNSMRALGSYLKLQQVRLDYGNVFADAIQHEPMTAADITGEPLPWKVVQWFYGHSYSAYHPETFQPHVQPEDLAWHEAENVLADLHPALEFWQGSQLLALLDGKKPVSLNLLDVALSVCNGLEYGERVVHHMRENLGRELLARYLHEENLQNLLLGKLDEQLAPEIAFDN